MYVQNSMHRSIASVWRPSVFRLFLTAVVTEKKKPHVSTSHSPSTDPWGLRPDKLTSEILAIRQYVRVLNFEEGIFLQRFTPQNTVTRSRNRKIISVLFRLLSRIQRTIDFSSRNPPKATHIILLYPYNRYSVRTIINTAVYSVSGDFIRRARSSLS